MPAKAKKRGRPPAPIRSRSLNLWIPDDLHDALRAAARRQRRSINAEVRDRLFRSFPTGSFKL
jgi:predicted HicB family RNase H-like nuclease